MNKSIDRADGKPDLQEQVYALFREQLHEWDLARLNYLGLEKVRKRSLEPADKGRFLVQYNPGRIISATARVDKASISKRPCFLCQDSLPPQQKWVQYTTEYLVLVNPYPIFPVHFTISHLQHTDQLIQGKITDMLLLAMELDDFVVLYNGPQCGASAPDHFHFQAGSKGFLPIENETRAGIPVLLRDGCELHTMEHHGRRTLLLQGSSMTTLVRWAGSIFDMLHTMQADLTEPLLNLLATFSDGTWQLYIFPRKAHRPWQYHASGPEQVILSPGAVDLGGVLITPREEDYLVMEMPLMENIFKQVCIADQQWQQLTGKLLN